MAQVNGNGTQHAQPIDLDEIPFYLRETVQRIIDKRVKRRVDQEMSVLKQYVRKELADIKTQN